GDLVKLQRPPLLPVLPVIRQWSEDEERLPDRILFEGARSGSGETCDWGMARRLGRRAQLVLAGGLTPENVAAAIDAVDPFGVDVSSGVEERAGIKSPARIQQFVMSVRSTELTASKAKERR